MVIILAAGLRALREARQRYAGDNSRQVWCCESETHAGKGDSAQQAKRMNE